jgi:hypothetical protein
VVALIRNDSANPSLPLPASDRIIVTDSSLTKEDHDVSMLEQVNESLVTDIAESAEGEMIQVIEVIEDKIQMREEDADLLESIQLSEPNAMTPSFPSRKTSSRARFAVDQLPPLDDGGEDSEHNADINVSAIILDPPGAAISSSPDAEKPSNRTERQPRPLRVLPEGEASTLVDETLMAIVGRVSDHRGEELLDHAAGACTDSAQAMRRTFSAHRRLNEVAQFAEAVGEQLSVDDTNVLRFMGEILDRDRNRRIEDGANPDDLVNEEDDDDDDDDEGTRILLDHKPPPPGPTSLDLPSARQQSSPPTFLQPGGSDASANSNLPSALLNAKTLVEDPTTQRTGSVPPTGSSTDGLASNSAISQPALTAPDTPRYRKKIRPQWPFPSSTATEMSLLDHLQQQNRRVNGAAAGTNQIRASDVRLPAGANGLVSAPGGVPLAPVTIPTTMPMSMLGLSKTTSATFVYKGIQSNPPEIVKSGTARGNYAQLHRKAWLEVSDKYHRYGKNLRLYYRYWERLGFPTNMFFDWLDSKGEAAGLPLPEIPECPRSQLDSDTVLYITNPEVTKGYAVTFAPDEEGRALVIDVDGDPVETGPDGWIFVLRDHAIYAGAKVTSVTGRAKQRFHHSSFFGGKAVASAGIFITGDKGVLRYLYPHSGHYRPSESHVQRLLYYLYNLGIDLRTFEMDMQQILHVARDEPDKAKSTKPKTHMESRSNDQTLLVEKIEKKKKVESLQLMPAVLVACFLAHKARFIGESIFAQIHRIRKTDASTVSAILNEIDRKE